MPEYMPLGHELVENPYVSVCITTFNHEPFIAEAIESVLAQSTDFPLEIIIGEDHSTDKTREICKHYKEKSPRKIRLFLNSRDDVIFINGSPTGRRNFLNNLESANGKYIAMLDGDDRWMDPNKLSIQFTSLEARPSAVLSFHDSCVANETGQIIADSRLGEKTHDIHSDTLATGAFIPTNTVFFRRDAVVFPQEITSVPNLDTYLFALLGKSGYGHFNGEIRNSLYRVHDGGIWSKRPAIQKCLWQVETFEMIAGIQTSRKLKIKAIKNCLHDYRKLCYLTWYAQKGGVKKIIRQFIAGSIATRSIDEFLNFLKDVIRKKVTGKDPYYFLH